MAKESKESWYFEQLTQDEIHAHRIKKVIAQMQTSFQKVEILDTHDYGRCLFSDGLVQSTELDEFIYHESLIHPALILHPNPIKVFVGGGGEGAPLREILKHPSINKIVMVEIDKEMVTLAKKYLRKWHQGAFNNHKVKIYFQDARKYVEKINEKFDCIFMDLLDPGESGPAKSLFTIEFYRMIQKKLTDNGILVIQAGSANLNMIKGFSSVYHTLKHVFHSVLPYQAHIPSYVGPWAFFLATTKELKDYYKPELIAKRLKERNLKNKLKYYDSSVHTALFTLPPYFKIALKGGKIITDRSPLFLGR